MLNILLFFGTILAGIILSIISSPVFSFVLYEAMYFFNPPLRWWGHMVPYISYSYFVVILMMFLLVLNYKKHSENKIFSVPHFKWIYSILVIIAITSFYAVYPDYHVEQLIYFLKLVIIITIAYKLIINEKHLIYAIWGYIYGSWYLSFVAFQVGRNSGNRVEGIGTVDAFDSNGIAAAIAPSLVLCLYYFWKTDNKKYKLIFAFAGVFIANALILINSRGSFLGAAISLLYFISVLFFSSMQKKYQKATVVWMMVAGLAGSLYIVDTSFINRIISISDNTTISEEHESGSTRVIFWMSAWDMTKDFPLGTGINGFQYYAPIYIPANIHTGASRNRAVHSTWFEALSEFGYIGLFLLIMLLRACFKSNAACKLHFKKNKDIDRYFQIIALEAALISFLISMTFINRYRAEILYWLILFIACAYNVYIVKRTKNDTLPLK